MYGLSYCKQTLEKIEGAIKNVKLPLNHANSIIYICFANVLSSEPLLEVCMYKNKNVDIKFNAHDPFLE
jgi:hypothetical protein